MNKTKQNQNQNQKNNQSFVNDNDVEMAQLKSTNQKYKTNEKKKTILIDLILKFQQQQKKFIISIRFDWIIFQRSPKTLSKKWTTMGFAIERIWNEFERL